MCCNGRDRNTDHSLQAVGNGRVICDCVENVEVVDGFSFSFHRRMEECPRMGPLSVAFMDIYIREGLVGTEYCRVSLQCIGRKGWMGMDGYELFIELSRLFQKGL